MSHCVNCGERVYNGACTNCHESVYIREQYIEQDMEVPDLINKECSEHVKEIEENLKRDKVDVLALDYNGVFTHISK